ncbi:hypothetical protein Pcinc_001524 [Petrolisthes cinctipes]|uniref:Uncharacterized protein n=1 Tax=Petrolisthes cinctipes TaxID=88211 RepID=A0AAE1L3T4_PETCI|nr:hypothetical protein Pcinc_001524 [Petrolisthes cinctipes]
MLCGTEVDVLRDTECSTVVVRKGLVPSENMTGETCLVKVANSTVECYPLARVTIKSTYYTGTTKAVCMDAPVYDVMVGNIPGATELQNPLEDLAFTDDVETREASLRAKEEKPRKKKILFTM